MAFDLFYEFFQRPILEYSGYNPVNTFVYMGILLAIGFGLVFPFFKKRGIDFDFAFFKAMLPYIVFGSAIRVFEERHSIVNFFSRSANPWEMGYYFVSPGIYIMIGLLTILALFASTQLGKKLGKDKLKIFGLIGWALALPVVLFHLLNLTNPVHFFGAIFLIAAAIGAVWGAFRLFKHPLLESKLNLATLVAQASDACVTFVAINFLPFSEQHFMSALIIEGIHPIAFIPVKIALVLLILYFVDKEVEDPKLRNFIKIFVIILGFAPGIRGAFSLGLTTLG